ncbi:MAG: type I-U CRISPR-associated protein Csx17 [Phycisphaeraceae bacterium]|nr:type I-U CRISPR-associated protein Csx17 [Phycisphaeraceae bacterium]
MTKPHVHELTGLKPDALATYLAALGVIRLLAEQRDASARGFWRDEHFVLVTELSWEEVQRFFLEDYEPTPILAPWNLESGFFSLKGPDGSVGTDEAAPGTSGSDEEEIDNAATGDSETDDGDEGEDDAERAVGDPVLDAFAASSAPRLAPFRSAIEIARAAIPEEVLKAEEDARNVHADIRERVDAECSAHQDASRKLEDASSLVSRLKADEEVKKSAAKGSAKSSPAREELTHVQELLKKAREEERNARAELKACEKQLKAAEKQIKKDVELRARIVDAKKRFTAVQKSTKARLIAGLRARWSEHGQQWVDAAVALDERQKKGFEFTSLFGSGGNDGRMEFTKNFRQHLHALFNLNTGEPLDAAGDRLLAAVFGATTNLLLNKAVGQFFPGRAGGTNMGAGFFGGAAVNPWEFVLMLEGAIALVAGMSRRGDVGRARVSSPFWVEAASAGFGSASELEGSPRGEQWLPLWGHPLEYGELVELIREGRAQVGHLQTTKAGDLVRAAARLGLARGIEALQRFAYLERNGQSNLAVSAGRFRVASRSHQALLEEVAPWIDRLVRYSRRTKDNNVPLSLGAVARRAQEALFAVCRHDATPTEWRELLVALGEAEFALLRSGKSPARRPLPRLSWAWITAADDGSSIGRTVLRLALSLASQHRPPGNDGTAIQDSIRGHFLPVDETNRDWPRFRLDARGRAERDPELVCLGRDLVTDAIALVRRRSIWARTSDLERDRAPQLPLWAAGACEVTLEEVGAWVRGEVADAAVYALARPLLALDWDAIHKEQLGSQLPAVPGGVPEPLHMLLRLAHLPFDIPIEGPNGRPEVAVTVRLDPEPLRRLAAGDLDGALRVVVRRLGASGLRPVFRRGVARPGLVRRLAASLAFPISQAGVSRAARLVCKPYEKLKPEEHLAAQAGGASS